MAYEYSCPKRFDDLNAARHVDHAVIIDYLQEARIEFLLSAPEPMSAMLDTGVLVAGHQIEYLAPIGPAEPTVDVRLWIDHVGGAQFVISYRLSDGGREVARARTTAVAYDLASERLRRITRDEREQLTSAREPAVSLTPFDPATTAGLTTSDQAHHSHCRTRWADLDSYGHVNNVRFFDYFSQARLELITSDSDGARPTEGAGWRVARQDLTYSAPLDFRREPYLIRTVVTRIGDTRVEFAADIIDRLDRSNDEQTVYATARTVLVHTCADGTPRSIDQRTVAGLRPYAK